MNTRDMENFLLEILEGHCVKKVLSLEEAGLMTYNRGVLVVMEDDSRFQIFIVKD